MKRFMIMVLSIFSINSFADNFALDNITKDQFSKISKEFGANFIHSPVTPPNSLGSIFGFEVGLIVGATSTPETDKAVKSVDSDAGISAIPHAALMGQLSIPWGLSVEATMFPEKEFDGLSLSTFSGALKWTLTESWLTLPFINIATKFHFSSSEASYKTSSSVSSVPVNSKVTFDSSSWGASLSLGVNLLVIKPYVGVGYISHDTDLSVSASSGTIFDSSFTSAKSASESHSGMHTFAGAQISLLLLHISAEYAKITDVEKYTVKLSLGF